MVTIRPHSYGDNGNIVHDILASRSDIPIAEAQIPDLWHIAQEQENPAHKAAIMNTWHMAHEMLTLLQAEAATRDH